jgi:DNA-binding CsgD family transcriptional regulator
VLDLKVAGYMLKPGGTRELEERLGLMRRLTERESEVLEQVLGGATNKEIAELLSVSVSTIKFHITHILEKLGARDREALIARFKTSLEHRLMIAIALPILGPSAQVLGF